MGDTRLILAQRHTVDGAPKAQGGYGTIQYNTIPSIELKTAVM